MHLSNKNKTTANYTCSLKPKKRKPSEQKREEDTEKRSDNKGKNKKQKLKKYITCGKQYQRDS